MDTTKVTENIDEVVGAAENVLEGADTVVMYTDPDSSFGKGVLVGAIGCGLAYGMYKLGKWGWQKLKAKKALNDKPDEVDGEATEINDDQE